MKGKEVCWAFFCYYFMFISSSKPDLSFSKMVQNSKSYHPDRLRQFLLQCRKGGDGCYTANWFAYSKQVFWRKNLHTDQWPGSYHQQGTLLRFNILVEGCWLFWWGYLFTRLLGPDPDPQCPDDTDLTCLHWQKVASPWKKHPQKRTEYEGEEKSWVEV